MNMDSFEVVFYTVSFLVPGFIMHLVISAFQPQKELKEKITFLRYLTMSSINYALWSWLIYIISQEEYNEAHPQLAALFWFGIIFVSPVVIGAVAGIAKQKEWLRNMFRKLGVETIHSIPTAWDYIFSKTSPVWILVTLKDGSTAAGWFGSDSIAATKADGMDIYIQEVYAISEGKWEKVERSAGIWIEGGQISSIEFRNDEVQE